MSSSARRGEAIGAPPVLGVLNVTPDSFSDGGRYTGLDAAIARGHELAAQGAQIVDIGGESTRPGAEPVQLDEELSRVIPVIEALVASGIEVSIDTIHAETARRAVAAGASIINDVSGGLADPEMYRVAAETGALYIIGHWRGIPDVAQRRSDYVDVTAEVGAELARLAQAARDAGVAANRIVLDPGLGFDKTAEQGWALLAGIPQLRALGYPVLVGVSRKRMLGELLEGLPASAGAPAGPEARDLVTSVVSAFAARAGAWGVRVHDVPGTVQALAVAKAWEAGSAGVLSAALASAQVGSSGPIPGGAGTFAANLRLDEMPSGEDSGVRDGEGGRALPADRITLTGLEVFAHHGVFEFERERGQRFLIDAELAVDLRAAASADELASTVHYGELAEAIVAAVAADPVDLIETVAERVADVALGFAGVREARITVHKPEAPIEATFDDVSVTVVRRPSGGAA